MWKITKFKIGDNYTEIKIAMLIKEMAKNTYASYAGAFDEHFKILIKEIRNNNGIKAENMYRITTRNLKSIEIWKMTVQGDFNYKMFQLDYVQ